MNIFWLSVNFILNAEWYSREHRVKIILEITQCLFSALYHHGNSSGDDSWKIGMTKVYKQAHKHHPVVLWITEHPNNFRAACIQALALCSVYTKYHKKTHACETLIYQLMQRTPTKSFTNVPFKDECFRATVNIPLGCTPVPCCMPVEYIICDDNFNIDLTASYTNYYLHTKLIFASGRLAHFDTMPPMLANAYAKII